MNLKLKLICALLFCFSFFNMKGQTKTETVQQGQDRLKNFVTKNDPADEPYRKEMYKHYLVTHNLAPPFINNSWELPNSTNHINSTEYYKEEEKKRKEFGGIGASLYAGTYCMKITKISYNELGQMIRDIEDCLFYVVDGKVGYGLDNYLECHECTPQSVGGVKVPPLFLVGDAPCTRVDFVERFYKYYVVKRRDPEKWLEVINQKNTNGETLLDFMKTLETHGNFNTDETRACAIEIIKFVCEHGGVHAFDKGSSTLDFCEGLKSK